MATRPTWMWNGQRNEIGYSSVAMMTLPPSPGSSTHGSSVIRVLPSRRRGWVALGAGLVAVLAAGLTVGWLVYRPLSSGPLTLGDGTTDTGFSVDVGATGTFGGIIIRNTGSKAARIDRIELVPAGDLSAGRLVDVRLLDRSAPDSQLIGAAANFVPPRSAVAPAGASIRPTVTAQDAYQILFFITMSQPGSVKYQYVRIDYVVGWARHHVIGRHSFKLCAPVMTAAACDEKPA